MRIFLYLAFLGFLSIAASDHVENTYRNSDICGRYNNHRVYLDRNERGVLYASNVTYNNTFEPLNGVTLPRECNLELVTCTACVIKISLVYSNFHNVCIAEDDDHVLVSEPPYDPSISGKRLCGSDVNFTSFTRSVNIRFIFRHNYSHAFSLEYFADKNRITVASSPSETVYLAGLHNKSIASPFFPAYYPRDFTSEYQLTCITEACRIHVIFTDFQISPSSTMEMIDSNGDSLGQITGLVARPKPIISSGPSMVIHFSANGGTGLGFKAEVKFLTEVAAKDNALRPITDCGGFVDTFGGAITMMKMLTNETDPILFDCIWMIRPPNSYLHLKTHLMLRVDAFESMAGVSELVIKQGLTSDRPDIDRITYPHNNKNATSWIVPITTGFYVSLKGIFGQDSRLAIVYSVYSYMNCFAGSEFMCANHRCIPIQLHCDGFDHCGDNSDEPEACTLEWETEPIDRRWYAHTPNYYFPKIDRYPDLKAATTVFLLSTVGLLALISCLVFLLYKTGARAREQRELQSQLQTISELLDNNNFRTDDQVDDPPTYEAPPEYDEVVKMSSEGEKPKRNRSSGRKSRLQRPRNNDMLEVNLPPMVSVSPSASEVENNLNISILRERLENSDIFSRSQRIDHITTLRAPIADISEAGSSQQISDKAVLPESPPPAYVSSSSTFSFAPVSKSDHDVSATAERSNSYPEAALNVQLSLSMTPNESPPNLWTETSQNQKQWHIASISQSSSFDSITLSQVQEINAYFVTYGGNPSCQSCSSCSSPVSSDSLLTDSRNSMESHENSNGCLNCPSSLRLCATCGGKLSLQELKSAAANVTMVSQIVTSSANSTTATEIRLCNCFPTTSGGSQHSIHVTASTSAFPSKAISEDRLMTYQRETEVKETSKSQSALADPASESMEAICELSRVESGF